MADQAETTTSQRVAPPTLPGALGWEGFRLDDIGGTSVARVSGVYVDAESGEPVWLVVKVGRFGKVAAVPLRDCAAGSGHIWCPYDRETLRNAPGIDAGRPLTREQELAICAHYGIRDSQARAGEVSGRPAGAVTAKPPA